MKLTFIVLQYNTPEETKGCIDSIQKKMSNYDDWNIVIVDNGSTTENYNTILDYNRRENIDVIRIVNNQGFSRGNNFGFEYTKKKYDPDFYYFMSNDTLLLNEGDLIKLIEEEYERSKFGVLGPDITDLEGRHTSPFNPINSNTLIGKKIKWFWIILKNLVFGSLVRGYQKQRYKNINFTKRQENVLLHGAALIFSKDCFNYLKKPFYPETFLFEEEDLLKYNLNHHNLKIIYNPALKILHKESISINKNKSTIHKRLYHFININKAQNIAFRYKKEYKE